MPSLEDRIIHTLANLRSVRADYDEAVFITDFSDKAQARHVEVLEARVEILTDQLDTYLSQVPHHVAA
ncbi:hypothetical protein QNA24_22480 [Rhodococcus qingshengii]|uniref:hypothetical protein n=1 Tax=Rhodococcus qingshengii TaxID=334542 RepID=UPI0024BB0264|nr:hypothetical protein [Rhodococcus qingshengii]MDJ0489145.1 hypothetical protein [Rhodococcus qingshengii]